MDHRNRDGTAVRPANLNRSQPGVHVGGGILGHGSGGIELSLIVVLSHNLDHNLKWRNTFLGSLPGNFRGLLGQIAGTAPGSSSFATARHVLISFDS
jgi:hypothetical protein